MPQYTKQPEINRLKIAWSKKKSMENIFVRSFHYETIYFLLARLLRQMSTKYPLCIAPLCTTLLRNKDTSKRWNVTKLFRPRRGGGGKWYISAKLIRRKKKNNNKNNKKNIYNGGFEYFFFFFFLSIGRIFRYTNKIRNNYKRNIRGYRFRE